MPKRTYTPDEKKLVRRLLLIHAGNVPIVQHLTGFPKRTIHYWREQWDDDYELYTDALAQNLVSRANALATSQHAAIQGAATDSSFAQIEDRIAQYRQIRANLMNHATMLSQNLALDDGQVNQRVHALTRLLDRLLLLESVLEDPAPQQHSRIIVNYGQLSESPNMNDLDNPKAAGDTSKSEQRHSGAMVGFTQENAERLGMTLEELLEGRPAKSPADTGETPEGNRLSYDDLVGGLT